MSEEFLVSVCVITYNHEKYIGECLDSILNQKTSFKFNVFVSDDCSQDNTLKILRNYESLNENLSVVSRCGKGKSHFQNRPTGNMNFIENLQIANGTYIAICDGDDVWTTSDKLQNQVDVLSQRNDLALICSSKNVLCDGKLYSAKLLLPDIEFSSSLLCFFNPIPSSSALFRRSDFRPPPKWFFYDLDVGDWPLWYQITRGKKILRLSKPLLNYRIHAAGTWGQKRKSDKASSSLNVVTILRNEYGDVLLKISRLLHLVRLTFYQFLGK